MIPQSETEINDKNEEYKELSSTTSLAIRNNVMPKINFKSEKASATLNPEEVLIDPEKLEKSYEKTIFCLNENLENTSDPKKRESIQLLSNATEVALILHQKFMKPVLTGQASPDEVMNEQITNKKKDLSFKGWWSKEYRPWDEKYRYFNAVGHIAKAATAGGTLGGACGGLCLPFVDLPVQTSITNSMIGEISKEYGYDKNLGVIAKITSSLSIAVTTASTAADMLDMVPGIGAFTGAATSAAVNVITGGCLTLAYEVCKNYGIPIEKLGDLSSSQWLEFIKIFASVLKGGIFFDSAKMDKAHHRLDALKEIILR